MSILDTAVAGNITLGDLIAIAVILIAAIVIGKFITVYLKKALSDRVPKAELNILLRATNYLIILLGLIAAAPYFEVNLSGLLVAGGVAGVVIGFASQSVVSNLISGLFLIVERPIKIGDTINIGEVTGTVEEIRVLSTIVSSSDGTYTRIPNERVFTSNINNYVANAARRVEYTVGIGYRNDANSAISLIKDLLSGEPFVLRSPAPQVFVEELGTSTVNIRVFFWAPSTEWMEVKSRQLLRIKQTLEAHDIELPYPQTVVHFARERAGGGGGLEITGEGRRNERSDL